MTVPYQLIKKPETAVQNKTKTRGFEMSLKLNNLRFKINSKR